MDQFVFHLAECRVLPLWMEMLQDALEVQDLDKHKEAVEVSHTLGEERVKTATTVHPMSCPLVSSFISSLFPCSVMLFLTATCTGCAG